jgi:hypothetical protein
LDEDDMIEHTKKTLHSLWLGLAGGIFNTPGNIRARDRRTATAPLRFQNAFGNVWAAGGIFQQGDR